MEWNGHQGGPLVSPGEGKTGAVQAGGTAVEVLRRKEGPTGGGVKRPSKAGNPTGALELASGRCPRAERSRFQITAEENENKSSPERCFFKSARGC